MRVVFVGASKFGLRCLEAISELEIIEVVGVLTNQETFKISYNPAGVKNVLHANLCNWATNNDIPCYQMKNHMQESGLVNWIKSLNPDLMIVVGWYHLIPPSLRNIAPAIGLHASLLPDYSGGAPLVWAMINGESRTGITLFQMGSGVDSGPVIGQAEEPIYATETISSLYARIEKRGLELLALHLPALAAGTAVLYPQDESARRVFPQRSPEDGWIDWNQDAKAIDRFIRAQTRPYPGAFTSLFDGRRLTIWTAVPLDVNDDEAPSTVTRVGGLVRVQCAQGSLLLEEVGCESRVYTSNQLESVLRGTTRLGLIRAQEFHNSQ